MIFGDKTSIEQEVIDMARDRDEYWRPMSDSYWFSRLMGEVGELGMALVGEHEHPPDWELKQIASICLNWLEKRADDRRSLL